MQRRAFRRLRSSLFSFLVALTAHGTGCALIDAMGDGDDDDEPPYQQVQLWAVHPPIVPAGHEVWLEGEFWSGGTNLDFEVFGTFPVEVGETHRASFDVPNGMPYTGAVEANVAGDTSQGIFFRATPFPLELTGFSRHYPQTGAAIQMPRLDIPREGHTALVVSHNKSSGEGETLSQALYLLGGASSGHNARATVGADGTVSNLHGSEVPLLTQPRAHHCSVQLGAAVYLIGGSGGATGLRTIDRAPIETGLGEFAELPENDGPAPMLTTVRNDAAAAVIGSYLYVIGGYGATEAEPLATIERARIDSDGNLGQFELYGAELINPRSGHTVEVIGDLLYVIGGRNGGAWLSSVEFAVILPGGPDTFHEHMELGTTSAGHASVYLAPYLYVIGGESDNGLLSLVQRARLLDGTFELGQFEDLEFELPEPRAGAAAAILGNDFYLMGGHDANGPTDSIVRASIVGASKLGSFQPSPSLGLPRASHSIIAHDNVLFAFGGDAPASDDLGDVGRTQLSPNGQIPAELDGLPSTTRQGACFARYNGGIYMIGGAEESGVTGTVLFSTSIYDNDQPEALLWESIEGAAITPRRDHACAVIGEYVYVIGGTDTDGEASNIIERLHPDAGGGLLRDDAYDVVTLPEAVTGHGLAVAGDQVYLFGGTRATSAITTVWAALIADDGIGEDLGPFTDAGVALATATSHMARAIVGSRLYLFGGADGASMVDRVQWTSITGDYPLTAFTPETGGNYQARRAAAAILVGNYLHLLGGWNSNQETTHDVQSAPLAGE